MALTGDIKITQAGVPGNATQPIGIGFQLAASTTVYGGSICLTNAAGYVKNAASPASTATCWGLVRALTINASTNTTTGLQLDVNGKPFEVAVGTFFLASQATWGACTQATIGQTVYVVDEQTIASVSSAGALPKAGVLVGIDLTQPGGYAVRLGSNESTGA